MNPWYRPKHWCFVGVVLAFLLVGAALRQHRAMHGQTSREASNSKGSTVARSMAAYLLDSEGFYTARTLRYDVCNGFANQRIAIAYGVVMAHYLGRAAILPDILMNGTQGSDDWTLGSENSTLPLSIMYDSQVRSCCLIGLLSVLPSSVLKRRLLATLHASPCVKPASL